VKVALVNTPTLSEPPYRRPRIESPIPEWGDSRDVQRIFGIKESHLYQLMKEGTVKSILVKGRGRTRGKRLINFSSIRRLLATLEAEEPQLVPTPRPKSRKAIETPTDSLE
jgi:hypothetical protein